MADEVPSGLRAITINGTIQVESEEDVKKRKERRAKRKSRWENLDQTSSLSSKQSKTQEISIDDSQSIRDNPIAVRDRMSMLPATLDLSRLDEKSQKIYLLRMQIQEATLRLRKPDLGIPQNPRDRSPSPEPVYNNKGVRINTRLERTRSQLLNARNVSITKLKELDPAYEPPSNFKYKNVALEDKVMLPAEEYPHINFVGLILGPRGKQLEEMKTQTNCQIVIRGKGSLRSGMTGINKDGHKYYAMDEPLHAQIQGQTAEDVKKAVKLIQDLVDMEVYNPGSEKAVALRAKQMHQLAVLNGTVKDIDLKCLSCGRLGHQSWQCTDAKSFTSAVICLACGAVGHVSADCRQRRPGEIFSKGKADPKVIDKEYEAFLGDMGGTCSKTSTKNEFDKIPSISGGIGGNGDLANGWLSGNATQLPPMLTNGSAAPGAASAHVRSLSTPQTAGGSLQTVGSSIFGGKLTRMTAGYKSEAELELQKERQKREYANRPVPLEWQVERYEKAMEKQHKNYLERLEKACEEQKRQQNTTRTDLPPPPPPPGSSTSVDQMSDLPNLSTNPWQQLKNS